jgi:hypothetical protein
MGGCVSYLTKYISKMTLIGEPTLERDIRDRSMLLQPQLNSDLAAF